MITILGQVMEKEDHHCVLAVSHGDASFNFLRGIGTDMDRFIKGLTNGCIFVLEYEEGRFELIAYVPNPITN
ncbi:MAG: histidine phosphatase family protein [Lachnospiraceae bacterium]|nr:histidine phosphatase family protein [Lachnospiraceae bacterium]